MAREPYWLEGFPHTVHRCPVCGQCHTGVLISVVPLSGHASCHKSLAHDENPVSAEFNRQLRSFDNCLWPVSAEDLAELPDEESPWGDEWWEDN